MDFGFDVHCHRTLAAHHETERACHADAVEQRAHRDLARSVLRRLDIEVGEIGEVLDHTGYRRVHRNATRRDTILVLVADGAEIGGAKKRDPVVFLPIQRPGQAAGMTEAALLKAKPGEARGLRQLARDRVIRHLEVLGPIDDFARFAIGDNVHADALGEVVPEMEERDRELSRPLGEQRILRLEAQKPMRLIVDLLDDLRSRPRWWTIRLLRQSARTLLQGIERKRCRRPQRHARGSLRGPSQSACHQRGREGPTRTDDHLPAIDLINHCATPLCCIHPVLGRRRFGNCEAKLQAAPRRRCCVLISQQVGSNWASAS